MLLKRSLRCLAVTNTGQEMRLVLPPADHAGGRCMNLTGRGVLAATATLREATASSPFRDEIAAQLWACGCSKVWLSRGSIRRWALAPEPRRLPWAGLPRTCSATLTRA